MTVIVIMVSMAILYCTVFYCLFASIVMDKNKRKEGMSTLAAQWLVRSFAVTQAFPQMGLLHHLSKPCSI